MNEGVVN